MGVANESAGRRLALRVWKRVMPEPRWPTGFVDLPRDVPPRREAGGPEVWWAMGIACVIAFVGYIVGMFGIARVNSAGLSAWVPSWWWVLTIGLTFLEQRSTERPSPRVTVVRSAAVALMGALSVFLVHAMLSNRLLALGHYGDNPSAPVGAVLGCAIVPIAPTVALVALLALRRGRALTHRALSWLVAASVLALGVLVLGACVRHQRAPDVATWLEHPPETLRVPSFTRRPDLWERLPPDEQGRVLHRRQVHGLVVESWGISGASGGNCTARIGLRAAPDLRDAGFVYFPCDEGPSFGHDPIAQLLIPKRDFASVAFDYGLRRVVHGGVREVRRPLAPVSEWTIGGALGLLLALWILRDAMRTPKALDRTEWRQGARYLGEHEIVFDDGSPPLSASIMPAWCRGPVVVRVEGGWLGPGYRDDRSGAVFTALAGSFDEVDRALRDVRDAALARALAIVWVAGAPLAACGWAGLLW